MNKLLIIFLSLAFLSGCKYPDGSVKPDGGVVIFSDLFTDNRNDWDFVHNDSTDIKILQTEYQFLLTGKSNKSGQLVWKTIQDLDTMVNFSIQADFRYIKGDSLAPYGLVFGFTDVKNYNFFGIEKSVAASADPYGGFIIGSRVDGVFTPSTDWTQFDLKDGWNTLKVEKNGSGRNNFSYSINGKVVATTKTPDYVKTIGFYAASNVSMAVNDVTVISGLAEK